jgi:hypothetical protein
MSYTVDNVDILRDISANSITFINSDTNAFIGCVNDSTYYTPNNTFVDFDFSDKSSASNKRPLLINPWSDGASGGVVIGSRDASSLKGFTGGNYMLDVNGMIKCSTPATTSNDTSVATTAFVKAQSYATLASPTFSGTVNAVTIKSDNIQLDGNGNQMYYNQNTVTTNKWLINAYSDYSYYGIRGWNTVTNGWTDHLFKIEQNGRVSCSTPATTSNDTSVATTAFVKAQSYITSLSGYATETWVNGKGYITSLSGYATETWVNGKGYLKSSSLSDASISDVISTNVECITVKLGGGGKWLIQDENDKLVFRFVNQTTGVSTVQGIFNPP